MIDLYFHKSPNTYKVAILLESVGLEYNTYFVNVGAGEQFLPEFVAISPNSKVPVIRDRAPADGGEPLTLFESNAILLYLSEKTGQLLPASHRDRFALTQWLFWQGTCQGPMFGQAAHFTLFASHVDYARDRYQREVRRLCQVLNDQLSGHEFVVGDCYSIADIACYPWLTEKAQRCVGLDGLDEFPHLARWCAMMGARPDVIAGIARLDADEKAGPKLDVFARNMFGLPQDLAEAAAQRAGQMFASLGVRFEDRDE